MTGQQWFILLVGFILGAAIFGVGWWLYWWFEMVPLRKYVENLKKELNKKASTVRLLTAGDRVSLSQHERRMILAALNEDETPFKERIQAPQTRAFVRQVWRDLRTKLRMSTETENDETKEAP